jgi:hypothetical protein
MSWMIESWSAFERGSPAATATPMTAPAIATYCALVIDRVLRCLPRFSLVRPRDSPLAVGSGRMTELFRVEEICAASLLRPGTLVVSR